MGKNAHSQPSLTERIEVILEAVLDIEKAEDENAACEAALEYLALLEYPSVMISFLKTIDGQQYVVADQAYATHKWKTIAEKTVRPYDVSDGERLDLLPAVLKRGKPRFIPDSREDDENDTVLNRAHGLITQYVVPLATESMKIGALQVDMGELKKKPELECTMFDALAAHLSVTIERYRTLAQLEVVNNELMNQAKIIAFEASAMKITHELNRNIGEYVLKLKDAMRTPAIKTNKAAMDFLKLTWSAVDGWIEAVRTSILSLKDQEQSSPLDAGEVVQETIETWLRKAKTRNCKLHGVCEADDTKIHVRLGALREILGCLIVNAIEAGARHVTVKLMNEVQVGFVRKVYLDILVIDDGYGLLADFEKDLAKLGRTTKGKRGHGIGLTIVTLLAKEMGGSFHLISAGKCAGEQHTEFRVRIPVARPN